MPAFSAINVEPEESVDEEIDNSRELQVEDALKLFQTALKLHSQGPRFFNEATTAYNALLQSDIFKYPEARTEYERHEAGQDGALAIEPAFIPALDVAGPESDSFSSSLPQAYYLSHKNHGQFAVDRIKYKVRKAAAPKDVVDDPAVGADARRALEDFSAALDRDPSDAELWRKTARIAAFLKSTRISRYSLEAAIELDDDPAVDEVEPPSLAEGFAGEQLKEQLEVLGDEMALTHPIMKPFVERGIPSHLGKFLDPIPFLPNPTKALAPVRPDTSEAPSPRLVITLPRHSWTELGAAIIRFATAEGLSGQAVLIESPDSANQEEDEDVQMEIDMQLLPQRSSPPPDKSSEALSVNDQPSAQQSAERDVTVEEPKPEPETLSPNDRPTRSLPSRKRSHSAAGIPDPPEEESADVKRSKRTRRRDTTMEEAMDPATLLATQLQPLQAADQNLFQTTKNLLENLGVTDRTTLERIGEILDSCASDDRTGKIQNLATVDLRDSLLKFDEDTATVFLSERERPELSLTAFLEHAKSGSQRIYEPAAFDDSRGLKGLIDKAHDGWSSIQDVVYEYLKALTPTYTKFKWSEDTKSSLVQVVSRLDASIYERITYELDLFRANQRQEALVELAPMVQMLFELHLDVFEHITNPSSAVDESTRAETQRKVRRWLELATEMVRLRDAGSNDELSLRFLWAVVYSTTFEQDVPREHILNCWHSLLEHLSGCSPSDINLPNNTVMPEISAAAAEREISKLTTMDFFLGMFQEDMGDPTSVIDTLEPVLNPESVYISIPSSQEALAVNESVDANDESPKPKHQKLPITECASQGLIDLWKFLKTSGTELRLLLWSRLAEAYGKIAYKTKQFSCFLRSIETVITDFERGDYTDASPESRKVLLMTMLRALDDLIIQSLHLALNDNTVFDIIDEDHLKSTLSALAKVNCLMHVAAMYDDETRIGMTPAPSANSTLRSFLNKLQEMQVRTWSLQYTMIKVGISQHSELFPNHENDLAEYLSAVHQVLGLRKCCKASNKIFLKMMRIELLKQKNIENWEDYLGQVLYDLHGLKLGVGVWEVQEHGCETENLEKRQALQLVEKITVLANRMPMKDLLKSDLKITIERMQQAIGSTKSNPQMTHNLRNYTEYLKTPIHPLHLFQALRGGVHLDAVTINTQESAPAKHGWFFLLGMIALTKFKGVELARRQTPGAIDDLRIGATFLRLQLQFTPDRWDAWFRLAECFDYDLDESVLWSADKMNKDRAELVKFQRNSIHCYTLALSHSYAWEADTDAHGISEGDEEALYNMFHEFGMRMYASSREPFAMEPFQHPEQERWFIGSGGEGTFKKVMHNQMSDYQVWKFAAHLFKRAMVGQPKNWKNTYMVAKCLWKMYQKPLEDIDEKNRERRPTVQTVLNALEKTVEVVSALPKPRSGQDPILEPHYKILSVVNKLVLRGDLPAQEGANVLARQPYAPDRGREVAISNDDDWESYVIRCVRYLRDKDKSNWQHRIIIRHARILFDENAEGDDSSSYVAAKAAFSVLRENMFTKTMVMNVWKCDAERPGRHHVYTERYIRFVVRLLVVLNDRANLEALLRRIRKKGADFYHFNELWQHCVVTFVKLLRQAFNVLPCEEDVFKNLSVEDFDSVGEKITDWATSPEAENHGALTAMKEAVEMKKLNANLMKAGLIDDLIADCYSAIYLHVKPNLPGPEVTSNPEVKEEERPDMAAELKSKLLHNLLSQDREPTVLGSLRAGSEQLDRSEKHSVAGEAAPRTHRVGVRRPNVLRKADDAVQAVLRAAEVPKSAGGASGGTRSRRSFSSGRNGLAAGGEEGGDSSDDENGSHHGNDGEDVEMKDAGSNATARRSQANGGDHDGSDISSPPGSVHDDADDESDLSDVPADYEDNVPPSLLFPNLRRSVDAATAGDTGNNTALESTVESDEEEEEEEVEEEEEGEEGEEEDGHEEGEGETILEEGETALEETIMEEGETILEEGETIHEENETALEEEEDEEEEEEDEEMEDVEGEGADAIEDEEDDHEEEHEEEEEEEEEGGEESVDTEMEDPDQGDEAEEEDEDEEDDEEDEEDDEEKSVVANAISQAGSTEADEDGDDEEEEEEEEDEEEDEEATEAE
ncbi:histone transcription regulator 3 [Cladorrhinum sp. PSN259]|nr:histone transcription regulator 3 [Cladorrhinum sp. PSN259]